MTDMYDNRQARPVNVAQFKLEEHVDEAFRTAQAQAAGRPINARLALMSAVAVHRTSTTSEAFRKLESMLPFAEIGPTPPDQKVRPELNTLLMDSALADSFQASEPFLQGGIWGRDYITAALLAADPSLGQMAEEMQTSLASLRDQWFEFVTSSKEHRDYNGWTQWWLQNRVPLPMQRSPSPTGKSYLLTWDPTRSPFNRMADVAKRAAQEGTAVMGWSVGNKDVTMGDRIFFMRHGENRPGLFGSGQIAGDPWEGDHWDPSKPQGTKAFYARILVDTLTEFPLIQLDDLKAQTGEVDLWTQHGSGLPIAPDLAQKLEDLWDAARSGRPLTAPPDTTSTIIDDSAERASFLAGFAADTATGADRLDITNDVNAFSSVFAAKKVNPPLCLGLFGDWGSGKTFFMEKMRDRIKLLAEKAGTAEEPTAYCSNIVQIEFNAWHYIDTNLWASLVSHIFDELAAFIRQKEDAKVRLSLFKELETAKELLRQAKSEQEKAKTDRERAEEKLEELQQDKARISLELRNLKISQFRDFLEKNPKLQEQLQQAISRLGLSTTMETAEEIISAYKELQDLHGRLRATTLALIHAPDRWVWIGLLLLLLLIIPLAPSIMEKVLELLPGFQDTLSTMGAALTQIVTFTVGVTTWINGMLKRTSTAVTSLEDGHQQVETFLQQVRADPPAAELEKLRELGGIQDRETAVKRTLVEAQERYDRAQNAIQEIDKIEDGQFVADFIQERVSSGEYEKHLGIISLIRKDFDFLSKKLLRKEAEKQDPDTEEENADAIQSSLQTAEIDRIILYIDDLDRCPEDKVVQVLQAVHLLLAFELFIVVVGVDSRWLLRSLEQHYPTLQSQGTETGLSDEEIWAWASTPQNYLEKIFQIPFYLRPMNSQGLAKLAQSILPVDSTPAPERPTGSEDDGKITDKKIAAAAQLTTPAPEDPDTGTGIQPPPTREITPTSPPVKDTEQPQPEQDDFDPNPDTLRVRVEERNFIPRLSAMLPTPRAAKRFINIYRLIRASIPDQETYINDREYKAVMILLAILTGFPRQSSHVFRQIRNLPGTSLWTQLLSTVKPIRIDDSPGEAYRNGIIPVMQVAEAVEWRRLHAALSDLEDMPDTMKTYQQWALQVARFSFRVGKVVNNQRMASDVRVLHIEYRPPGDDLQGEYVRIQNQGHASQIMTGWTLRDDAGHTYSFPEAFRLPADGTVTVWTKNGRDSQTNLFWKRKAPVWNNKGDTASLQDADGRLVSSYSYSA